jgi:hypothetical protein
MIEKKLEDKTFEELAPEDFSKLKIEFAPGCFDSFEGTQEELTEFVAEITRMFQNGEVQELSRPLDIEELIDEDPEYAKKVIRSLSNDTPERKLQ